MLEETYMTHYKNKNTEAISNFWHEEFIGWPVSSEIPVNKLHAQSDLRKPSDTKILSFEIRPQAVYIHGKMAIAHYFIDVEMESNEKETSTATYRIIHTWIKENDKWRVIGGMSAK